MKLEKPKISTETRRYCSNPTMGKNAKIRASQTTPRRGCASIPGCRGKKTGSWSSRTFNKWENNLDTCTNTMRIAHIDP
jgi:hypothetical protein